MIACYRDLVKDTESVAVVSFYLIKYYIIYIIFYSTVSKMPEIQLMPTEELPDVLEYVQGGLKGPRLKLESRDLHKLIIPRIHYIGKTSTLYELNSRIMERRDKIASMDLEWNDPKEFPDCPNIGLVQIGFPDGHIYLIQRIEQLSGI